MTCNVNVGALRGSLDAFIWSDKYATGLETIDAQHRGLVDRINAFGDLIARGVAEGPVVSALLTDLVGYAHAHFFEEESLMMREGIDDRFLAQQQGQHQSFLTQVESMCATASKDSSPALFRFLVGWLASHILGTDQQMARQLAHLSDGLSAAAAFEREYRPVDESSAVLLDAVDDLMHLIRARNEELERLNADLEQRVEARTADLSATNAELRTVVRRLEETQVQLLQAEKMASIGTLASGVAHELNNPVGFVYSNLATLKGGVEGLLQLVARYGASEAELSNPKTRAELAAARQHADLAFLTNDLPALLEESRQGLERVRDIITNLKDFSHVDGDAWQEVQLQTSLDAAHRMLGDRTPPEVTFVRDYGPAPAVRCLIGHLNHASLNLVTNAVQAVADSPGGKGTITLRTGGDATSAWLEVSDTGVGMSDETKAHAFEPFFSTRPIGKGTGLGLSVVWATAQQHGGRIELTSALGRGTTARLSLPLKGPSSPLAGPSFANIFNTRRAARR